MSTWWQGKIEAACGLHSFMIGNMLVKIELDSFRIYQIMSEPRPPGEEDEELLPPGVEQDEQEVPPPGLEEPTASAAPQEAAPVVTAPAISEPVAEPAATPVSAAPVSEAASEAPPAQSLPPPAAQAITPVDYSGYGYGAYGYPPAAGAGYAASYGYDAAYWNYYYPQGYAAQPAGVFFARNVLTPEINLHDSSH